LKWQIVIGSEDAEAKSFWDDFLSMFGISRRRVAEINSIICSNI